MLIQEKNEKDMNDNDSELCSGQIKREKETNIDPKTYCKLGHFHLLLENYAQGKTYVFLSL